MKWPPRIKDQKSGCFQLGIFVRGPDGDVAEVQLHDMRLPEWTEAQALLGFILRAWTNGARRLRVHRANTAALTLDESE